jgi:NRPS condensation-like uncharacterized protein
MEVAARGDIDAARLQDAIATACARHPLARARLRHWRPGDRAYRWLVPDALDVPALEVVDCADDDALADLRAEHYSRRLPLDVSPPLRAVLARRPHGDIVLFCLSHVATDGVGAHRLLQSVARAYRGTDDPPDPLSLHDARELDRHLAPADRRERRARAAEAPRRLREALRPPARIAPDGGAAHDGYGFVGRILPPEHLQALLEHRPPGATFNDVLLAASMLTVARWNAAHGRGSDRVSVTMPVNTRPQDWFWDVVGNYASFLSVSSRARDRPALAAATTAVTPQTQRARRDQRVRGLFDLMKVGRRLPLILKRPPPALLNRGGSRFVDSIVVSNLGRLPDPLTFDEEAPAELWFSPPCIMPIGVGIGAATTGGRLHLALRHRFEQFDRSAALRFIDLLVEQLVLDGLK